MFTIPWDFLTFQGSCGNNLELKMDQNVIEIIPDVQLERDCKQYCLDNTNCKFYTYYTRYGFIRANCIRSKDFVLSKIRYVPDILPKFWIPYVRHYSTLLIWNRSWL